MKTLKAIVLLGLLSTSASALAEKIGVSMAYFDPKLPHHYSPVD